MKKSKFKSIAIVSVMAILFITPVMAENTALFFTAANEDYVDCGNDSELQLGTHDLTVEFWLKTDYNETAQKIISNGGQADLDDGYSIKMLANGFIKAEVSDGTTQVIKQNGAVVANDGNWHHCAVVFDRDHQLRLCVDGICQTQLMETVSNGNCDNTNDTFVMGRTADTDATQSYTGSLDEVRIWNTALDAETVTAWQGKELTNSHPDISALQAYYKFNEGLGTTTNDLTYDYLDSYESDGTITGAAWVENDISDFTPYDDEDLQEDVVEGNAALSFTADYVDCGNDVELQLGTHDLTVEFWFKTAVTETTQRIIGNGGSEDSDDGYSIWINNVGRIRAGFSDGTTSDAKNNETIVTDGNWHHCAVVFDRDGKLWVCVDGTCQTKLIETLSDLNCDNTNDTFVIGRTATGNSAQSFTGSLDEVRIWNTVIDTATVFAWQDQELTSSHPNISNLQAYYKFNEGSGTTADDLTAVYEDNHASDGTINGAQYVTSDISDFTTYDDDELGIFDEAFMPGVYVLHQNYPNPFNPVTAITFVLPTVGNIRLRVFDMVGQDVALIASGIYSAGSHTIIFNGADLPSGIYFYTLYDGSETVTRKMILMK